jgi:hypothetical protein
VSCPLPGDVVMLSASSAEMLEGCDIPVGVTFRLHYTEDLTMDPVTEQPSAVTEAPAAQPISADLREAPSVPAAPQTSTVVEVPAVEGAPDLSQLESLAGGNPMLMLAMAVLVVVGGGAGWRFWTKMSEQKHEQAMAKLALEREMAGLHGAQPPPCQTANAKIAKDIEALEKRLGKIERRASPTLPADFDADDLIARVEKLEKAAKPARVAAGKA